MSQSNFGRVALGVHDSVSGSGTLCPMDVGPCGGPLWAPVRTQPITNPVVGTCSSTSPEFCTLSNIVGTQVAGGSPSQPYLQDNGSPLVVPTQSSSPSKMPLIMVVLVIAGAVAYFYYRKHGGEKLI
jgi:hypothetical protein